MSEDNKNRVLVIGYPKSGNTWLVRLLSEVTSSRIDATNVVDDADNSTARKGDYLFTKLHDTGSLELRQDTRVVYIIRDVRDVLVSAFFFINGFVDQESVKIDDEDKAGLTRRLSRCFFNYQIRRLNRKWGGNGLAEVINVIRGNRRSIGNWSSHILSWADKPGVVWVRYEDLLSDTETELSRVLQELSISVPKSQIRKAVENQSFTRKKSEFQSRQDIDNVRFMRSGKSGEWRSFLLPEIAREIESVHADVMRQFGYL